MHQNANFKFRDIKIYGNNEWLANNVKKYRSVFDVKEACYVYCELSLFNKKYDEENWGLKLALKCFDELNKEICDLTCDRTIDKNDPIVFVREGWGVITPGTYWKSGTYRWDAFVENELISSCSFYIENQGLVKNGVNPYFKLGAVRLYEGPDANVAEGQRKYSTTFNTSNARYVWVELYALSKVRKSTDWACELTFNYKTSSGYLKGSASKLLFVEPDVTHFNLNVGWGSDTLGTWCNDTYCIEVVFMDEIIKRISFRMGDDNDSASNSAIWRYWQKIKKILWPARNLSILEWIGIIGGLYVVIRFIINHL